MEIKPGEKRLHVVMKHRNADSAKWATPVPCTCKPEPISDNRQARKRRKNGVQQRKKMWKERGCDDQMVKEDFFLFDQQRAMDAAEIVAHTLRINPYRMKDGFDEKEKIRMATFDFGGVPTLSTLCCYIQDRPGLDGKQLVTWAVEDFLRNKGKHPDFETVLKEDAPKFLEYCTWVKNATTFTPTAESQPVPRSAPAHDDECKTASVPTKRESDTPLLTTTKKPKTSEATPASACPATTAPATTAAFSAGGTFNQGLKGLKEIPAAADAFQATATASAAAAKGAGSAPAGAATAAGRASAAAAATTPAPGAPEEDTALGAAAAGHASDPAAFTSRGESTGFGETTAAAAAPQAPAAAAPQAPAAAAPQAPAAAAASFTDAATATAGKEGDAGGGGGDPGDASGAAAPALAPLPGPTASDGVEDNTTPLTESRADPGKATPTPSPSDAATATTGKEGDAGGGAGDPGDAGPSAPSEVAPATAPGPSAPSEVAPATAPGPSAPSGSAPPGDAEKEKLDQQLASEIARRQEAVQQLSVEKGKREEAEDRVLCVVCLHQERSVYFQSCRHIVVCGACDGQITNCPVCNMPITRRSKNVVIS